MSGEFPQGATIFVPSEIDGWIPMVVVECRGFGDSAIVQAAPPDRPADVRTLGEDECGQVQEADPLAMQGSPDMVKFSKLSESTLLHNLLVR
jgi:myosin heavy subunit